jgi:hypothetical protein
MVHFVIIQYSFSAGKAIIDVLLYIYLSSFQISLIVLNQF